jgi:putative endonuclease
VPMRSQARYYVYMMASLTGTLYVGVTNSIYQRVTQHREGLSDGFTKKYGVNRLVYFEVFQYVDNAIAREKQIKGWSRAKKVALIEPVNPSWRDLSKDFGKEFKPENPCDDRDSSPAARNDKV